ncbi:MAG: hypothetical protein U0232_08815 [Thermomicrobiales bacterium]
MAATIETRVVLTAEQAAELQRFAQARHLSQDQVIAQALDVLFRTSLPADGTDEPAVWSGMSEEALGRVWDNDADAAYDDWQELYGLPAR